MSKNKVMLKLSDIVYILYATRKDGNMSSSTYLFGCFNNDRVYGKILVFTNGLRFFDYNFTRKGIYGTFDEAIKLFQTYLTAILEPPLLDIEYFEYILNDWTLEEKRKFIKKHPEIFEIVKVKKRVENNEFY